MEISLENLYVNLGTTGLRSSKDRVAMIQSKLVFEKINWKKSKAKKNAVLIYIKKSTIQLGMTRSKN